MNASGQDHQQDLEDQKLPLGIAMRANHGDGGMIAICDELALTTGYGNGEVHYPIYITYAGSSLVHYMMMAAISFRHPTNWQRYFYEPCTFTEFDKDIGFCIRLPA